MGFQQSFLASKFSKTENVFIEVFYNVHRKSFSGKTSDLRPEIRKQRIHVFQFSNSRFGVLGADEQTKNRRTEEDRAKKEP